MTAEGKACQEFNAQLTASGWGDQSLLSVGEVPGPYTKSGVLREITSRLTKGLEREIPELEKRVNHILTKQVFGLGVTRLTRLLDEFRRCGKLYG